MPFAKITRRIALATTLAAALSPGGALAAARPVVLAASSLQESLTAVARAWAAKGHPSPVLSFAASSALARQIAAGAPADLYLSADDEWMSWLERRGALRPGSRKAVLTNRLVLVAPSSSRLKLTIKPGFALGKDLGTGRLAMADPDGVPAGTYGREALIRLGVWPQVATRIARTENVRAALALVARGATPMGIVYATDAKAARGVRVIDTFPVTSHRPIRYAMAVPRRSREAEGEQFGRFLRSAEGQAIFRRFGFGAP